jgi:DNA repair exonuclease SbcCD ATPase subunit
MTEDVRQWLAEIKSLQQKLVKAQQERDEAYASAAKWRSLYETEAKQRRTDTNLMKQAIATLQAEIEQLQQPSVLPTESNTENLSEIEQQVAQLSSTEELQEQLTAALIDRDRYGREVDRLNQVIKTEQAEHTKTRKNLTTALGDTVDMLTKERSGRTGTDSPIFNPDKYNDATAIDDSKNPLLQLPKLD